MTHIRVVANVTERTEYTGVNAVVNVPDFVDPTNRAAVAEWLRANSNVLDDALTEVGGEVETDSVDIERLRVIDYPTPTDR